LFAIVLSKPDGNCTSSIGGSRAPWQGQVFKIVPSTSVPT
jgi:hypothetical protein